MKKLLIIAAAALLAAACAKTYEVKETTPPAIGFGTWAEQLTKAGKTGFENDESFDVWGVKNPASGSAQTVFDQVAVTKKSTGWEYSPKRYWDPSFPTYTFHAVWPSNAVATGTYAGNGLFVSNPLVYDGTYEKLLVAGENTVNTGNSGNAVEMKFYHAGALIDFKFKKHSDLEKSTVAVTAFSLANIQTTGTLTVDSYDATTSHAPVFATVGTVAGLGWALPTTGTTNADAAPYKIASSVSLAPNTGTTTSTAASLIPELVIMPQVLDDTQTFTIAYTITDESNQVSTFTPAAISLKSFDKSDNTGNGNETTDEFITAWMPGVHYIYYITINANAIQFSASIEPWTTTVVSGYHYLVN